MSDRSRPLDGIRGLAILAVVIGHSALPLGIGGYLGVDVFFVLSGYLITTILLRERERTGRVSLGRFYLRRALRLFPALIVACVAVVALAGPLGSDRGTAVRAALTSVAYLQDVAIPLHWHAGGNLFHTWSLAVEEQFYLVWPAVMIVVLRASCGRLPLLAAVLGVGIAYTASAFVVMSVRQPGSPLPAFRPDARGGALLVGCLLAVVLLDRRSRLPRCAAWAALGVLGAGVVFGQPQTHFSTVPLVLASWAASFVLVWEAATGGERLVVQALAWRPLGYVGLISYGLYLYHPVVFTLGAHELSLPRRVGQPIAIVVSIAFAAASYHLIESPFLALKNRLRTADVGEQPEQQADERVVLLREQRDLGGDLGIRG